jgi:hypothetical protein
VKAEGFVINNNEIVVTETQLRATVPADLIVEVLRENRITGQLTFHMIEGGVRSVMLTARRNSVEDQTEKIVEILRRL